MKMNTDTVTNPATGIMIYNFFSLSSPDKNRKKRLASINQDINCNVESCEVPNSEAERRM